jgi:serine/threonine protein kinase
MAITTVPKLVKILIESRLLNSSQVEQLSQTQHQFPEPIGLASDVVRRGWLTRYQIEQLGRGRPEDLFIGSYVLLEPVGEGGMGRVFRARHQRRGHIVALKVVRQERRGDAKAMRRFRREVKAVMRLDHPNLVMAIDAAEVGNQHYFAMEYVPGINLDLVMVRKGAIPLAPACDYMRQAALGLQHIFDRGLIHRDIKPSNLLIVPPERLEGDDSSGAVAAGEARFGRWGTLKILDLGLVLLPSYGNDSGTNLTKKGFALGTVEYVAPEQVMNPHEVDIRADLYSLGCTLYEMLTGQTPFPNMGPVKTLLAHQTQTPTPVDQLRPDLPTDLAAVVQKLLIKAPEKRYQRPAEVAQALGQIVARLDSRRLSWDWSPPPVPKHERGGKPPPREFVFSWNSKAAVYAGVIVLALVALFLLVHFSSGGARP